MTNTPELDVHDMVRELTQTHSHRQVYVHDEHGTAVHWTREPALVRQLLDATPSVATAGEASGSAARSKPIGRLESLDALILIDDAAGEWIDRLGGVIPADPVEAGYALRTLAAEGTIRRLNRLHGLHPSTETCEKLSHSRGEEDWCCQRGHLEHDVRRWWQQARIVTGWDSAAWKLNENTCPVCDVRGGLRIKLEAQSALCIECREVWPPEKIGLLAEWIRAENGESLTEETSA